jgi:hypothetical protein
VKSGNALDITGAGPKFSRSYTEDLLDGVVKPNPPDKEIFIGKKPTVEQGVLDAIADRRAVVDEALRHTDRVSRELLQQITDFFFNEGYTLDALQELATLKTNGETLAKFTEVLGEISPGKMANIEHVEGVAAVARAILSLTMTHHRTEVELPTSRKTPFQAWRLRDTLAELIENTPPKVVEPAGFDNEKVVKQFTANFKRTDIVLWNKDIWAGATRGAKEFEGTPLNQEILDQVIPMFWQYEEPIVIDDQTDRYVLENNGKSYECVGFVLMPTVEDFIELDLPEELVKNVRKHGSHELITINPDEPRTRELLEEIQRNPVKIARNGISIAIIFAALDENHARSMPEVRFLKPLFEGDDIFSNLYCALLAGLKFLGEKFVVKEDVEVSKKELKQDRHLFKQVRKGKMQVPPIKVINLRRTEVRHVKETGKKREYSCHFLVDAHWRKQWYASLNRHIPKYINTYLKGDENKPFRLSREKVYKAVR